MQIVVVMAMKWAGDHTITGISLRDYESTAQRAKFFLGFARPIVSHANCAGLFALKNVSRVMVAADAESRNECPLSGVKRTLWHTPPHVRL